MPKPFVLPGNLRGGKKSATYDDRDIKIREILDVERAVAKAYKPHDTGFTIRMYANGPDITAPVPIQRTGIGCCVFAMISNALQLSRHAAGLKAAPLNGTTSQQAYSEVTGYVLGDESTDQGTDMRQAANWWRKTGMKDLDGTRHKLGAYATFNPQDEDELTAVIKTFDYAGQGVQFPASAMQQFPHAWTYVAGSSIEGGHAILRSKPGEGMCWSKRFPVSADFDAHYSDECYAFIDAEILNESKETPEGLDLAALQRALKALA